LGYKLGDNFTGQIGQTIHRAGFGKQIGIEGDELAKNLAGSFKVDYSRRFQIGLEFSAVNHRAFAGFRNRPAEIINAAQKISTPRH